MSEGRRIAGKYVLLEELGRGGFGTVHRARHVDLQKDVALKLLNPELAQDEGAQRRFLREVENTTRFVHKFAVQLRDFGRDAEQGALYYTMDLVDGPTLRKLLRAEGTLDERRAARLCAQVCEALAEAHDAGLVHRDLKPENLVVTRGARGEEEIRVLDFGIAKAVSESREATSALTVAGQTVGTLAYMSPEQADGARLDGRSDLYSLAVVLYEMVSGRRPIEADPQSEDSARSFLTRLLIRPPTDLRAVAAEVSQPLRDLVMRTLSKEPKDRPADARVMRSALLALADSLGDAPTPDPDADGAMKTVGPVGVGHGGQSIDPRSLGGDVTGAFATAAPTDPGGSSPTPAGGNTRTLPGGSTPTLPGGSTPTLPGGSTPTLPGVAPPPRTPADPRAAAEDMNATILTPSARSAAPARVDVVDLAAAAAEQAERDAWAPAPAPTILRDTLPPMLSPIALDRAAEREERRPLEPVPSKSRVGLVGVVLVLLLMTAGGVVVGLDLGGLGSRLRRILASLDPGPAPAGPSTTTDPVTGEAVPATDPVTGEPAVAPEAFALVDLVPAAPITVNAPEVLVEGRVQPAPAGRRLSASVGVATADVSADGRFSLPVTLRAEGVYELDLTVRDLDAASDAAPLVATRVTITCDRTPPMLHVDTPARGAVVRGATVRVAGMARDPNGLTVLVCGQAATVDGNGGFAVDVPLPQDGRVLVIARDAAGLEAREDRSVSAGPAGPPLAFSLSAPGDVSHTGDVVVRGRAMIGTSGAARQTVVVSRAPEPPPGGPVELVTGPDGAFEGVVRLPDGAHTLTFARKGGGAPSFERRVRVDATAPVITLDAPAEGAPWQNRVRVAGRVEEANLESLVVNGQRLVVAGGAFERQVELVTSASEVVVVATDRGGRTTTMRRRLRGSGPSTPGSQTPGPGWRLVLDSPGNEALIAGGPVRIAGSLADAPPGPVELRVNGTPLVVAADRTFSRDLHLPAGRHELELVARVGGAEVRARRPITVLVPPAPTGILPPDPNEPNDSAAQAKPINPGLYPRIGLDGEDWYRVTVPAGHELRASIAFEHDAGDVELELVDAASDEVLVASRGSADLERARHVAPAAQTVLVRVFNCHTTYSLLVELGPSTPGDALEPNDDPARARAIQPGEWRDLAADGADWYRLGAPAGKAVEVVVEFDSAQGDIDLALHGASDVRPLVASTGTTERERVVYLVPPDGLLVRVYGAFGPLYRLTYVLQEAPAADRYEENDEPAQARAITPGTYPGLTLDLADWYRVAVPAGQELRVRVVGPPGEAFELQLIDGERPLATGRGQDEPVVVSFPVATDASLLLGVVGGLTTYALTLELAPLRPTSRFEPNDRPADARRLVAGRYPDLTCNGDDWYVVDLRANDRLVLTLDFLHAQGDLDVQLTDAAGDVLVASNGTSDREQVELVAPGGPVLVRVHNARNEYALTVTVNGQGGKGQR